MDHDHPIEQDIDSYLSKNEEKSLLRFITCGSVDDGKSTLLGRLLYETKMIYKDQLETLIADSKKSGTQGGKIDFALLVDGLAAERQQGITIDVAYRFFSTDARKYIVADCPGHEQYTRNMITGASNSDVAVVLIDARKGVLTQTRRHTYLTSLMGIKNIILAVNKMDLVDFSQEPFDKIVSDYKKFITQLEGQYSQAFSRPQIIVTPIPISALEGVNIGFDDQNAKFNPMPWYQGPSLLNALENIDVDPPILRGEDFILPIQWVNRPSSDFRGFLGTIASGKVVVGDTVCVSSSRQFSKVQSIFGSSGAQKSAFAGEAITLTLEDEIDISRGSILSKEINYPKLSNQFQSHLIWMDIEPGYVGRAYFIKLGTITITAQIMDIKYKIDVNTLDQLACKELALNDVAVVTISTSERIPAETFIKNKILGGFILIDRISYRTIAAGMIDYSLMRADNLTPYAFRVDKGLRAMQNKQRPACLWFTGLSGSGKSTIANELEKTLFEMGKHTYILDGDNVRNGLNRDLGFTEADRVENIRRVSEVAKLMLDAGLIVIVTLISPFRREREMARANFNEHEFREIFISSAIEVCEARDPKGLYKKARAGEIRNFTGIDSPYEVPQSPDLVIDTKNDDISTAVARLLDLLNLSNKEIN